VSTLEPASRQIGQRRAGALTARAEKNRAGHTIASDNGKVSDVQCEIESVGTRLLVRVRGELSVASAPVVRTALLKCLVEQPDALVVDLAELVVTEPAAASVFLAAAGRPRCGRASRFCWQHPGPSWLVCSAPDIAAWPCIRVCRKR
jgi:hypothetical protein